MGIVDEAGRGQNGRPDCPCVEDPENACAFCSAEEFAQHLHPKAEPDEPDEPDGEVESEDEGGDGDRDDEDGVDFRPWSPQGP